MITDTEELQRLSRETEKANEARDVKRLAEILIEFHRGGDGLETITGDEWFFSMVDPDLFPEIEKLLPGDL